MKTYEPCVQNVTNEKEPATTVGENEPINLHDLSLTQLVAYVGSCRKGWDKTIEHVEQAAGYHYTVSDGTSTYPTNPYSTYEGTYPSKTWSYEPTAMTFEPFANPTAEIHKQSVKTLVEGILDIVHEKSNDGEAIFAIMELLAHYTDYIEEG